MGISPTLLEGAPASAPPVISRGNVLGVGLSIVDLDDAIRLSDLLIRSGGQGYICAADVHSVIEAKADPDLREMMNSSFLTTADGMPLVWACRIQGHHRIDRVYGPDYMLEMCRHSIAHGYRHFFYGGKPGVAELLKTTLCARFPRLQVAGTYMPPFRALSLEEEQELVAVVDAAQPDIFWVGLGSPKQERFMARYCGKLQTKLMVGVGAAFDFHTGLVKEAPVWLKRTGLQWTHRLSQEPQRLWRRYLTCIPDFLWNITLQLTGIRNFELEGCTRSELTELATPALGTSVADYRPERVNEQEVF